MGYGTLLVQSIGGEITDDDHTIESQYYGTVPSSLQKSNNIAELYAIFKSLILFDGDLNIHTDSLLSINLLENKYQPLNNKPLVRKIKNIMSTRNIIFTYIYCHTYIQDDYATQAYKLAKMGI